MPPPPGQNVPRRTGGGRRKGCLWAAGIGAGLLVLLLGCVGLAALLGQSGGGIAGPTTYEEEYISGEGASKIAVLPVEGVITSDPGGGLLGGAQNATPEGLKDKLEQAADDPDVRAIVLEVDSPGGGVVESDEMYNAILDFKRETRKPVVVSMGGVAASGGYYISMAADRVIANRSTITGSLGVIFSFLNYEEAADRLGLQQITVKSGKFKDIGAPTREFTQDERRILQGLVNESYEQFVDIIDAGRPQLNRDQVRDLADGRIYSGKQAADLKLVDEVGDLDRAAELGRELAKVDEATVVRYEQSPGFFDMLQSRLASGEPDAITVLRAAGLNPSPELQYLYRP